MRRINNVKFYILLKIWILSYQCLSYKFQKTNLTRKCIYTSSLTRFSPTVHINYIVVLRKLKETFCTYGCLKAQKAILYWYCAANLNDYTVNSGEIYRRCLRL